MGKATANDKYKSCLSFLKDNDIEYVDFRFTDFNGVWHHMTFHIDAVTLSLLQDGFVIDGSSIPGWRGVEDSDLILMPDISYYSIDHCAAYDTVLIFADIYDPKTSAPYSCDPRSIAKRAEEFLVASGVADKAYFGPEPEFFLFDEVMFDNSSHQSMYAIKSTEMSSFPSMFQGDKFNLRGQTINPKEGYFPCAPQDRHVGLRAAMLEIMKSFGIGVEKHHHEVAPAQQELGFTFDTLCKTADNMQIYKYVVKDVAFDNNKVATFMPKPIKNDNGSGLHVHQSLWLEGKALFLGDQYAELSETALYYIGGILKHAKAINAFANPSINSYRRLVPGYEAPVYLSYGARNRSTAIRIPHCKGNAKRIEVRFPDPMANPYLAFSAMLMAGLDGIANKIHPGAADEINLYRQQLNDPAKHMASSLSEALNSLEADHDFLLAGGVFTYEAISSYISVKRAEVSDYQMSPTPWEFKTYLSR